MNRIKELRQKRSMTQQQLADLVGTSQAQIDRLEKGPTRGGRKLTEVWMRKIAKALDVRPSDLISVATLSDFDDEVTHQPGAAGKLTDTLTSIGLTAYKVISDAVSQAGPEVDDVIVVNRQKSAIESLKIGDIVVVKVTHFDETLQDDAKLLLRQFVPPELLTTNRKGTNISFPIDNDDFQVRIMGVKVSSSNVV